MELGLSDFSCTTESVLARVCTYLDKISLLPI